MDKTNESSFLNESDLRLSTSLCQWAGFELDSETRAMATSDDHSAESAIGNTGKMNEGHASEKPISPKLVGEDKADEMLKVVREFLLEKTSQFYNDIIDAQGEKLEKTGFSMDSLRQRYETLRRQTATVVDRFRTAGIEEELNNRLKSIDAALRQLSIMKSPAAATLSLSSSDSGRSSTDELGFANATPLHQWRHWIECAEAKMSRLRQKIDWCNREQLEQRLKLQQALQGQIEQEGGHWVTLVQKYIDSWPSSHRRQVVSASIERRWHGLWIKSLEWQCRLERQIRALLLGITDSSKEDGDWGEPMAKRRRVSEVGGAHKDEEDGDTLEQTSAVVTVDDLCSDDLCSATSDTIPFSENEYEPLTPRSVVTSHHEEEPNSARDGGYSSGSSAVVTRFEVEDEKPKLLEVKRISSNGSSPCLERRTRIENSPVKNFYQMTPSTPDDPTPTDNSSQRNKKSMPTRLSDDALYVYTQPVMVPPPELTDSLLVNVGDSMSETLENINNENNDDLEEILNLFRQGQERDTFELELEELLLRRQGTVWVPLLHDDEAEEERREQTTPTAMVETPPNTPSLMPPTLNLPRISSSGSLKRRRRDMENRRPVSTSFTAPCNVSDLAKMAMVSDECDGNLSSSWPPMTPAHMVEENTAEQISLLNTSRSGRKKLRACRLRRSWSFGMQLENNADATRRRFTNTMFERCCHSGKDSPTRPNTAVSNLDDERGSGGTVPCGSSEHSIGGSGCVLTGGGETLAEPETEEVDLSTVLTGNRPVWEWDDYKPPNHNENGPIDQPLLDDSMLTAFGDDYCSFLDQPSTPRTPDPASGEESAISPFSMSTRLSPIGVSYDSDADETFYVVRESHQELRSTHNSLKELQGRDGASIGEKNYIDFLSACEYNINRLEMLGSSMPVTRNRSKDTDISVGDLLQDWRDLALLLTKRILEAPPPAKVNSRTRSSEEEEQFKQALQNELRRLTQSLQNIMAQGAVVSSTFAISNTGNTYRSLEETQEILNVLKAVRRSLTAEKIRLDCILQQYDLSMNSLSARYEAISEEVAQLRLCLKEAYRSSDSQLRGLESLRQSWLQWQQTEELCRHLLTKICSQLAQFDTKTLQSNLAYLEGRVSRVEIAFAKLLTFLPNGSTPNTSATIDESILAELKDRTESLRRELDALKVKIAAQDEKSAKETTATIRKATRRKRSYHATTDGRSESCERKKTDQPQEKKKSLRRLLFRCWPIQVCLCILVCLNVFFFYPSCCDRINRYWWSFGSKLDFPNGPPPT